VTAPADPTDAIGVDPAAPRPSSVGFRLDVPDEFTSLDLDPATSDASIERLLDVRTAAVPEAARHRVRARQVLQRVVGEHRGAGVFLAAFLSRVGPSPREMVGASLTLAWRRFDGGIDLEGLETWFREDDPAPGEDLALRDVRRLPLPYGEAVRAVNRQLVPVPLTSHRQEVVVVQHLVPVPEPAAEWLAVLTMSTPDVDGREEFTELADRVAATLEFLAPDGEPLPVPGPPTGTIGFVPNG
jgi:hypothetical protein